MQGSLCVHYYVGVSIVATKSTLLYVNFGLLAYFGRVKGIAVVFTPFFTNVK